MTSLNVSLPEPMRAWIDEQVVKGGYGTASELVRELIREAQKRQAKAELEAKLIEGLDSGEPIPIDDAYWEGLKKRIAAQAERSKK